MLSVVCGQWTVDVFKGVSMPHEAVGNAPPPWLSAVPLALVFLVFYMLLIRPQRKQEAERKSMIEKLKKNDEIVTIGGVHGTIVGVKEKTFLVRIDDNVKVEVDKTAVASVTKVQGG